MAEKGMAQVKRVFRSLDVLLATGPAGPDFITE
jgi:hypothetical protein